MNLYNIGDEVEYKLNNKIYTGIIHNIKGLVVRKYSSNHTKLASYLVKEYPIGYKVLGTNETIAETNIVKKLKESNTSSVWK